MFGEHIWLQEICNPLSDDSEKFHRSLYKMKEDPEATTAALEEFLIIVKGEEFILRLERLITFNIIHDGDDSLNNSVEHEVSKSAMESFISENPHVTTLLAFEAVPGAEALSPALSMQEGRPLSNFWDRVSAGTQEFTQIKMHCSSPDPLQCTKILSFLWKTPAQLCAEIAELEDQIMGQNAVITASIQHIENQQYILNHQQKNLMSKEMRLVSQGEKLAEMRVIRPCAAYRGCIESIAPRTYKEKRYVETSGQAWRRVWEDLVKQASETKQGPVWDILQTLGRPDDADTQKKLKSMGATLYGRLSMLIHSFKPTTDDAFHLDPKGWIQAERDILKYVKSKASELELR
jgi:hypothetical protein